MEHAAEILSELDIPFISAKELVCWIRNTDVTKVPVAVLEKVFESPGVKEKLEREFNTVGGIPVLVREVKIMLKMLSRIGIQAQEDPEMHDYLASLDLPNVQDLCTRISAVKKGGKK